MGTQFALTGLRDFFVARPYWPKGRSSSS